MNGIFKIYEHDFCENEDKSPSFFVEYCLVQDNEGFENSTIYGIQLNKYGIDSEVSETDSASGISCRREYVLEIIDLLYKNTVTPVALKEVLIDML